MQSHEGKQIFNFFIIGFLGPPVTWIILIWSLNIINFDDFLDIAQSYHVYFYLITATLLLSLTVRNLIVMIEHGKKTPNAQNIAKAQKAIFWAPRIFIYALPPFALLTPVVILIGTIDMQSSSFAYASVLGFLFIFINSTPFFVRNLINLEKWVRDIPFSKKYIDLTMAKKLFLITVPNAITPMIFIGIMLMAMIDQQLISNEMNTSDYLYNTLPITAIILIWLGLIISFNLISMKDHVMEPIRKMNELMSSLLRGGGNITARLSFETRDELATLSQNYNRIMDTITKIVFKISSSSDTMGNISEKINQSSKKYKFIAQKEDEIVEEIIKSMESTTLTINDISESTHEQTESLTELIEKMQNAATYGDDLVNELETGNQQVLKTANMAQTGERSMNSMRDSMAKIHQIFQDIAEVLGFINDVAEKINLLSLNASIEAARAGEYGQGFSVVAQQIAKLAEETKKSVADITRLLDVSDEQIKFGTDTITDGAMTILHLMQGVEEIERLFGKLLYALKEELNVFKEIENDLGQVKLNAGTIERATHVQRDRMRSLMALIANMNEYSKTGIEATSELTSTASSNANLTESLVKLITLFRLKEIKDARKEMKKDSPQEKSRAYAAEAKTSTTEPAKKTDQTKPTGVEPPKVKETVKP